MPLDAIFLTALLGELDGRIVGRKIEKIQQPEQDQLLITLRGQGAAQRLLISAGTGDARLHLTDASFENPSSPPMFCMLLRKHLLGAKLVSVTQPPLERLADLTFDCIDALGEPGQKHLVLELMGRYSNIILTGEDGRIIDCLRRVDAAMSEKRQVLPGLFYRLPPPVEKLSPLETSPEIFGHLFESAAASTLGEKKADRWLLDTFGGLSPLVCRELVWRACGDTDNSLGRLYREDSGAKLSAAFFSLMEEVASGRLEPVLLVGGDGKPFDFSYTPIRQYGSAYIPERADGFSTLLETFYTRRFAAERMRQKSQSLSKTVRTAQDRIRRKLELQREELKKTSGRERSRELGDIITANLHRITKGQAVLRAPDYYSEDGREIDIRLDPLKSPQQNAAKYYKDYTKARNAESVLTEQVRLGEIEADYLASVLEEIGRAESERDLGEIRQELTQTGYLKVQKTGKKERRAEAVPMHFVSSSGFDIYVGRNNVQNDMLTNRLAYKTDIWLHTQKIPGSHVIISSRGGAPDNVTRGEAASLAAWFSEARGSKKVPVDTTLVKYVRKIPGGRPGMVTYTDYQTIIAEPDEALAARLRTK